MVGVPTSVRRPDTASDAPYAPPSEITVRSPFTVAAPTSAPPRSTMFVTPVSVAPVRSRMPASTTRVPVRLTTPLTVCVALPDFASVPAPTMSPEKALSAAVLRRTYASARRASVPAPESAPTVSSTYATVQVLPASSARGDASPRALNTRSTSSTTQNV